MHVKQSVILSARDALVPSAVVLDLLHLLAVRVPALDLFAQAATKDKKHGRAAFSLFPPDYSS